MAVQHRLPYRRPVPPSSVVERKIFSLVVVVSIPTVGGLFVLECALNAAKFAINNNSNAAAVLGCVTVQNECVHLDSKPNLYVGWVKYCPYTMDAL